MSQFHRFVALRYLRGATGRDEGRRFLRLVTYVAVGGVAVGTAALLLSLMIVRGFSGEIERKIVGFGSHVQVENFRDAPLPSAPALAEEIGALPEVVAVTPAVIDFALLRANRDLDGVAVWGTDPAAHSFFREHVVAGAWAFTPDSAGRAGLVLGRPLARTLGVDVGDRVTAFSMRDVAPGSRIPRVRPFVVSGIVETGLADFDGLYAFTSLDAARRLAGYAPDEVTRFDVTLTSIVRADETAAVLGVTLGPQVLARSVYRVYGNLFAWIDLQRSIIPLVIGVIVLVAAFNIVGTLLMLILEKTREIGVLAAMGAAPASTRRLFLWLGFLIGAAGSAIGAGLALVLGIVQLRFGLIPLPQEAYYIDTAPVELHALDFVLVVGIALALCTLAAYLPARVAARLDPIRTIRFGG